MSEKEPLVQRPQMPEGYGLADESAGFLPWEHVGERMTAARNYWIATASSTGRPHAAPVWGVWLDETFYFGTDRNSRKARNLAENPRLSLHLESGDDVVILEGMVEEVTDRALLRHVYEIYGEKYGLDMSANAEPGAGPTYAVRMRVAMAWFENDFPQTATRWHFTEGQQQ